MTYTFKIALEMWKDTCNIIPDIMYIYNDDISEVVNELRSVRLTEFTFSERSALAIDHLYEFVQNGATIQGTKKVKAPWKNEGEDVFVPAVVLSLE